MINLSELPFYNASLTAGILSWICAQIIKTLAYLIVHRKFNKERILGAGGMPSSHSALVTALAISISRHSGYASAEFAIAFVFALVVMYDAMGVRRAAGLHAKELNRIRKVFDEQRDLEDEPSESDEKELKEFIGHTPLEVLAGALLGILIAMMIPIN